MISDTERARRKLAYELAKQNSEKRGVTLTQETEMLMKKYVNGEIGDREFFDEIWKVAGKEPGIPVRH